MLRRAPIACFLLVLLAACIQSEGDANPASKQDRLIDQIVEGGYAHSVAADDLGFVAVGYTLSPEDDEGTYRSAWRLYDDEGQTVAEGLGRTRVGNSPGGPYFRSLGDRFVLQPYASKTKFLALDEDGETREFTAAPRHVTSARPGDVLVSDPVDPQQYLVRGDALVPLDQGGYNDAALADNGFLWTVDDTSEGGLTVELVRPGGKEPEDVQVPGGAPTSINVVGNQVYVITTSTGSVEVATNIWTRGPRGPWRDLGVAGIEREDYYDSAVQGLADGRVLVGTYGSHWYAGTPGVPTKWRRVPVPPAKAPDGGDWWLTPYAEGLLATGPGPALALSTDGGATWSAYPEK